MYSSDTGRYVQIMDQLISVPPTKISIGVKTHHGTDGNDHLEVGEMIVLPLTADLGKQVAAAPAEQRDQRKPEPHIELLNSFVLLFFR